jgi:hypothetical protein
VAVVGPRDTGSPDFWGNFGGMEGGSRAGNEGTRRSPVPRRSRVMPIIPREWTGPLLVSLSLRLSPQPVSRSGPLRLNEGTRQMTERMTLRCVDGKGEHLPTSNS